jgi:hypothetical protein
MGWWWCNGNGVGDGCEVVAIKSRVGCSKVLMVVAVTMDRRVGCSKVVVVIMGSDENRKSVKVLFVKIVR